MRDHDRVRVFYIAIIDLLRDKILNIFALKDDKKNTLSFQIVSNLVTQTYIRKFILQLISRRTIDSFVLTSMTEYLLQLQEKKQISPIELNRIVQECHAAYVTVLTRESVLQGGSRPTKLNKQITIGNITRCVYLINRKQHVKYNKRWIPIVEFRKLQTYLIIIL